VLLALALLVSCEKPEFDQPETASTLPKVEHGRLSFETADNYRNFISATVHDNIEKIVHDLPGRFESLKDYNVAQAENSGAMRTSEDDIQDAVVWDPYFENLVNKDREIAISGLIYRITAAGVFFYVGNETKPKMDSVEAAWTKRFAENGRTAGPACAGTPILIDDSIQYLPGGDCSGGLWGSYYWGSGGGGVGPFAPPPPPQGVRCNLSTNAHTCPGNSNIFGINYSCKILLEGTDDRRIVGKFWAQNYAIYSSAGCATKSQNRWAGIWWAENADRIYLNFEGEIKQKDVFGVYHTMVVHPDQPIDRPNDNKITRVFEFGTAVLGIGDIELAPSIKIKRLQTCHFISDEGRHAQVSLELQ
jgi:hypothetical protein